MVRASALLLLKETTEFENYASHIAGWPRALSLDLCARRATRREKQPIHLCIKYICYALIHIMIIWCS